MKIFHPHRQIHSGETLEWPPTLQVISLYKRWKFAPISTWRYARYAQHTPMIKTSVGAVFFSHVGAMASWSSGDDQHWRYLNYATWLYMIIVTYLSNTIWIMWHTIVYYNITYIIWTIWIHIKEPALNKKQHARHVAMFLPQVTLGGSPRVRRVTRPGTGALSLPRGGSQQVGLQHQVSAVDAPRMVKTCGR